MHHKSNLAHSATEIKMALFASESGKQFAKPATGKYVGTVIDVVDLGLCKPKNNNPAFSNEPVRRVQIIWNLVGPDGKLIEYSEAPPNKLGTGGGQFKPTRLYTIVSGINAAPPPQPFATFDVESIIGKSNELFIVKTGDGDNARSEIAGFLPVPPGVNPPGIPSDYKRKPHKTATATLPTPPAQPAQPATQSTPAQEVQF